MEKDHRRNTIDFWCVNFHTTVENTIKELKKLWDETEASELELWKEKQFKKIQGTYVETDIEEDVTKMNNTRRREVELGILNMTIDEYQH